MALSNQEMKSGRFARWALARKRVNFITSHLTAGHTVIVATPLKAWEFKAKHAAMFKATKSGAYMQRGKNWDCIDGCAIRVFE